MFGGVFNCGMRQEDDSVTWETLVSPRTTPGSGDPVNNLLRATRPWVHAEPTKNKPHTEVGRPQGEPERRPMGTRESESRVRAMTSGNGVTPGLGRAKAARVNTNFRREP